MVVLDAVYRLIAERGVCMGQWRALLSGGGISFLSGWAHCWPVPHSSGLLRTCHVVPAAACAARSCLQQ
jgi:hypothetical protein